MWEISHGSDGRDQTLLALVYCTIVYHAVRFANSKLPVTLAQVSPPHDEPEIPESLWRSLRGGAERGTGSVTNSNPFSMGLVAR